ncbi:hypothetical protein XI06_18170 [Bradyrhizobium sp. CCBAU 11434]|nr:hypothetical protein [Bradyrhizobium sp. CCBAU 11434]
MGENPLRVIVERPKRRCMMSDNESVIAAIEEAQRLLTVYDQATSRKNQEDLIAMLQFILCDPSVSLAVRRLKSRSRLSLVESSRRYAG